jgi:N6-L-threonylcarbamoyladenine synthase
MKYLLAIESSCDETSVALMDSDGIVLGCLTRNQLEMHAIHGGVIPEVAARDHLKVLSPLVRQLLVETKTNARDIAGIAATQGPGLVGALLVGLQYAQGFAAYRDIPVYGVNHLEGHVLAALLEGDLALPALAAVVSGGHTQLVLVSEIGEYEIVASTVDDAVGEAFDKVARLLELPYPGGPEIMKLAEEGKPGIALPRPLLHSGDGRISMSGLKTAVVEKIKELGIDELDRYKADLARSFQEAVADVLVQKIEDAFVQNSFQSLIFTGGVAANRYLRGVFSEWAASRSLQFVAPRFEFCTDNAAMIARAAFPRWKAEEPGTQDLEPRSRWPLGQEV